MAPSIPFFLLLPLFLSSLPPSIQQNLSFSIDDSPWRPDQVGRILVSPNSTFAAGFQSIPDSSQSYIFSIWYQSDSNRTILWSLNGDQPVNQSASLIVTPSGALQLNGPTGQNLWRDAIGRSNDSKLLLNEDGSLVFDNWTSFDYPTDTILPNQPFLRNKTTLIARRDLNSYAKGSYMFFDAKILTFNSSDKYWPGDDGNGFRNLTKDGVILRDNGNLITADANSNRNRRLTLDVDGNLRIYSLDRNSSSWTVVWQAVQELCTIHGSCGPNFICMSNGFDSRTCVCPVGFKMVGPACERKIELQVDRRRSKFLRLDFVNFTGGANQTDLKAPNFTTCESGCLANSRCLGFATKFNGNQYCVHQIDRLLNGYWSPGSEVAMFLRVDESEPDESNFTGMTTMLETICPANISLPFPPKESNAERRNLAIICSLFAVELISGVLSFWAFLRKYSKYRDMALILTCVDSFPEVARVGRPLFQRRNE
ncbi:putative receptor protein kinase ZmPK1 [Magnolia sinica]|uniref:putative receptor protein kinase ZmPK1 n=1 Tax=Magnolia sinica TaxID=86752 RepID=UPI0026584A60|nr:putative receptor protein kinase ZmPK1 [Magnolia sinica]